MTHRNVRSSRGFSLAEVLIAVALMGVIILAVFGLVSAGVRRAYGGKKMTQAAAVAQSALDRVNAQKAYTLFGAADTATTAGQTWTKVSALTGTAADGDVNPAAEGGGTPNAEQAARNAIRALLRDTDLPANATNQASLAVTVTPVRRDTTGLNFGNATVLRIDVEVTWVEFGTRTRTVHLQTMNLKTVPI